MLDVIKLPKIIDGLCAARNDLRNHYKQYGLTFTLDGKLVGDIGEVIAAEAFDLVLCTERTNGVDAHAKDGRSIQIKATGLRNKGPAYTPGKDVADHLIFLRIDFDNGIAEVAYNGPEAPVRKMLPQEWTGTKRASLALVLAEDSRVPLTQRLRRRRDEE